VAASPAHAWIKRLPADLGLGGPGLAGGLWRLLFHSRDKKVRKGLAFLGGGGLNNGDQVLHRESHSFLLLRVFACVCESILFVRKQ